MASPFTLTIDWLAFTIPNASVPDVHAQLGGDWIKSKGGFRGYPFAWICTQSHGTGKVATGAAWDPRQVHVDLSGGIVAGWSLEKVRAVLTWLHQQQGHVTRLDCALDDRESQVPVSTVKAAVEAGQCVSRARRCKCTESCDIQHGSSLGDTVNIGSSTSETFLRVYDKRLELQGQQRENWAEYGVRWELQFRHDRADLCAGCLEGVEESLWRDFVVSLLRGHVDFRETTREEPTHVRCRAPLLPWWASLTEGFRKGRLVAAKSMQTMTAVKRWVHQSVGPSLAVICATEGGQESGWRRSSRRANSAGKTDTGNCSKRAPRQTPPTRRRIGEPTRMMRAPADLRAHRSWGERGVSHRRPPTIGMTHSCNS